MGAVASRPNIICGLAAAEDALPRSGASGDKGTTDQCAFCLPRVGNIKASLREDRGTTASTVFDEG